MGTFAAMFRLKFAGNLNTVKVIGGNFSWFIVVWKWGLQHWESEMNLTGTDNYRGFQDQKEPQPGGFPSLGNDLCSASNTPFGPYLPFTKYGWMEWKGQISDME